MGLSEIARPPQEFSSITAAVDDAVPRGFMRYRVIASALLAIVAAACGGDGKITEPTAATSLKPLAAIGTDAATGATIETNLNDYAPGGAVNLTGRGWAPNETVHLVMTEDPDRHADVVRDAQTDNS